MNFHFEDPGLTVAIALAVGLSAQALGRHLRIPSIVLLLVGSSIPAPWISTVGRFVSIAAD